VFVLLFSFPCKLLIFSQEVGRKLLAGFFLFAPELLIYFCRRKPTGTASRVAVEGGFHEYKINV
jgi:hypothetical protein